MPSLFDDAPVGLGACFVTRSTGRLQFARHKYLARRHYGIPEAKVDRDARTFVVENQRVRLRLPPAKPPLSQSVDATQTQNFTI